MDAAVNPLLITDDTPLALPDFSRIRTSDFVPALQQAIVQHRQEIADLVAQAAAPDFDNSVAAFDRAGAQLRRVEAVFHNLADRKSVV